MNTWIGFFRGINVGGRHILPMKDLTAMLEELGCSGISTYIQSGNVVFSSKISSADALAREISQIVNSRLGFKPRVILLTIGQLNAAVEANPYPQAKREPKALHLFFLADDAINVDSDALNVLKKDSEQFALVDRVFYLYAPEGIGRSKLAARVENLLGVPLTARNWRTVGKVLQLAR